MLQAHSFLWHYLWVAPNALLLVLGFLITKRGLRPQFPAFFAFATLGAMGQLAVYAADVSPSVSPATFWRIDWANLLIEGILKFALVAEIFALVFGAYVSVAQLGKLLIRAVGVALVMAAALAAALAPKDGVFGIVSGAHLLEQTIYLIECGLLAFIFVFSSYFRLSLSRPVFGIALGLSISASVHLATWAVMANAALSNSMRYQLDFLNMATYNLCVPIWYHYLLAPQKKPSDPAVRVADLSGSRVDDLDAWNRELEHLIQQ